MSKKWLRALLMIGIIVCLLSGCAEPATKNETEDLLKDTLLIKYEYLGKSTEGDKTIYKYRDENGLEFEVQTWVEATPFEMQRIKSDYIGVLLRRDEDLIRSVVDKYIPGATMNLSEDYFGLGWYELNIGISNVNQLENAGKIVTELLTEIPAFPINFGNNDIFDRPPTLSISYNDAGRGTKLLSVSINSKDRSNESSDYYTRKMENSLANEIKNGSIKAVLPDEIMDRIPADTILDAYINGVKASSGEFNVFYWNVDKETYGTMLYEYNHRQITNIVKILSYDYVEIDERTMEWTKGSDTWRVEDIYDDTSSRADNYLGKKFYKNGIEMKLNTYEGQKLWAGTLERYVFNNTRHRTDI